MKKLTVLLMLGCATVVQAQPYGEWSWHEHDLVLTSASYNVNIPGHLMAGNYVAGNSSGKLKLLKVDQAGTAIFDEVYDVFADPSCQGSPPLAVVDGASAIETSSSVEPYAVSGSVIDGCFFATFDASGIVQTVKYFTFPYAGTGSRPGRTSLVEVPGSLGGGFLITGSYPGFLNGFPYRYLFVIRLDPSGNLMQSACYHGSCYDLEASSILVSPYTPNPMQQPEIVVVGEARGNANCSGMSHSEAFIMRLEFNTLNWLSNYTHRYATTSFINETNAFKSITPVSISGQDYFLLGGYSEASPTVANKAMMMLVDATGASQRWSFIYGTSFSNTRECAQVVQRISPTYGPTFYGGVVSASAGMLGIKVDVNGSPFTSATPIDNYNEFNYDSNPNGNPWVNCFTSNMSVEPNTGSSEGIHIYGTAETNTNIFDNWYMVKASFNGEAGAGAGNCTNSSINNKLTLKPGPRYVGEFHVPKVPGPTECSNISITQNAHTTVFNPVCSNSSAVPSAHSNARLTGISENSQGRSLSVWPNPAQHEIRIEFPSAPVSPVVKITDLNGRLVGEVSPRSFDSNVANYSLDKLDLENGVYMIEAQMGAGKAFTLLVLQR